MFCFSISDHVVLLEGIVSFKCRPSTCKCTVQRRKWSPTVNDPQIGPQMIPNRKWSPMRTANDPAGKQRMAWILLSWIFFKLVMFIFCLCDVGYWIRVNTVQKVKRKNILAKYVGSFTAEARTVYFFQVCLFSSKFLLLLEAFWGAEAITAHLIAFGGPRYTNILQIRSGVALHTNIYPEIFFDHLKRYLSAF